MGLEHFEKDDLDFWQIDNLLVTSVKVCVFWFALKQFIQFIWI